MYIFKGLTKKVTAPVLVKARDAQFTDQENKAKTLFTAGEENRRGLGF